jgi:hypothetical protein
MLRLPGAGDLAGAGDARASRRKIPVAMGVHLSRHANPSPKKPCPSNYCTAPIFRHFVHISKADHEEVWPDYGHMAHEAQLEA